VSHLPELRSELVQAAHRQQQAYAPERARAGAGAGRSWAIWRWRWAAVNVAVGLVGTLVGLSAAGVFHRGTALGPEVPRSASTDEGVAIARSVKLLSLRVADPGGGLPWGIRVVRTTRGLTCVDVGRVDFSTIGVLGQDGAFADDGRFHPVSEDVFDPQGCDVSDARGDGFVNVALRGAPASGLFAGPPAAGGCTPSEGNPVFVTRYFRSFGRSTRPPCPAGDLREIYFGLLGPQARSITYRQPGGGLRTIATSGPDGAYLLVLRQATSGCLAPLPPERRRGACSYGFSGDSGGPDVPAGVISEVTYRDGRSCHVPAPGTYASMFGSCPPVGFVAPQRPRVTAAQVRTTVSVRTIAARFYCTKGEAIAPCDGAPPRGYRRVFAGQPSLLALVSFTARVAVPDSASFYETELTYPHSRGCNTGGSGGPTNSDLRAGQRVTESMLVPYVCAGVFHGKVTYVPIVGPASSMAVTGLPGQGRPLLVGRFSFSVPSRRR
jgi:hypothetical protein